MDGEAVALKFRRLQLATFVVLFSGYASLSYNRKSVSFALPNLMITGFLDKNGAGTIASCQNTAYAISKFFSGVLSDKISARWLFCTGLLLSGSVTILFSMSSSLPAFAALWFLNGLSQGTGWPACAKLLKKWFSKEQFGTYWSILSASSNVAGSLCPFIAAWIMTRADWRASLLFSGVLTLVCSVFVMLLLRDSPSAVGFSYDFSATGQVTKDDGDVSKSESMTWKDLIKSPFLLLVSVCYLVVFAAKTCVCDWGQMLLIEDLGHSQFVASSFISSIETGGFCGGVAAGYFTDWLMKKAKRNPTSGNPRMKAAVVFMIGVAVHLFLLTNIVTSSSSQFVLTSIGFGLGVFLFASIAIFGIVASESYPAHLSGTAHAIVALSANVGAILSGLPCSYLAQVYGWRTIFILLQYTCLAVAFLMTALRKLSAGKKEKLG